MGRGWEGERGRVGMIYEETDYTAEHTNSDVTIAAQVLGVGVTSVYKVCERRVLGREELTSTLSLYIFFLYIKRVLAKGKQKYVLNLPVLIFFFLIYFTVLYSIVE